MPTIRKTRYNGEIISDLSEIFMKHCNENKVLVHRKIRPLLNELNLFPTHSQISELVHAACEMCGRAPVDHITFGEFSFFVTHLIHQYNMGKTNTVPRSQMRERNIEILTNRRMARRFSGISSCFQVFLGGSCNPTTWRLDVAIPFLKKHGITFYNPQVHNWRPELMELEDQAKQTAEVLFFVIDNQTRSTASMVEAAYIAGCGQQLILVIRNFASPVYIYDEKLLDRELDDLDRSHTYLTDLVERMSIPVFDDINTALMCLKKAVLHKVRVSELKLSDGAKPVKHPHIRIARELIHIKEAFNTMDTTNSGLLNESDMCLAYRSVTNENLNMRKMDVKTKLYSFEDFCIIISKYRFQKKNIFHRIWSTLLSLPFMIMNWLFGLTKSVEGVREVQDRRRDVFLGGSCGHSRWREDTAIPILRRNGITYFNPQLEDWTTHYIAREGAIKDGCQVLLYVITNDTRAMTSMLEAGYFIGQGCNIVLCIQDMVDGILIDNEQLTEYAVKDYNRSRAYLADLANRDGVPVLDNIEEAVNCVVKKLEEVKEINTCDQNR